MKIPVRLQPTVTGKGHLVAERLPREPVCLRAAKADQGFSDANFWQTNGATE